MTSASPGGTRAAADEPPGRSEVVVIGSGFSGIAAVHRLREAGVTDVVVLERGDDVGGTWRDNSYPGAACDVPSHLYSLSFAPNPRWGRSFSRQPEIQEYLRRTARDVGMYEVTRFGHTVTGAVWDDDAALWSVRTDHGTFTCRWLVSAVGVLSDAAVPDLPGLTGFPGRVFHSSTWDHEHDLTGERVAVVGTGASAVQLVPEIQPRVAHLTVFQRTPPWVLPRTDRPLTHLEHRLYERLPRLQQTVRSAIYWAREGYVLGFTRGGPVLAVAEAVGRAHLRRQVPDPVLRDVLTPRYRIGCKRVLLSNDYLPALSAANATVVPAGVREVRGDRVVAGDGSEHPVDTIVFGTGFQVTDLPMARWVTGRGGRTLAQTWEPGGMRAHLGTTVPGFPNLFLLVGPNTATGHTSQVVMIEHQVAHVVAAIGRARREGADVVEVEADAFERYVASVEERMGTTVWRTGGCDSWYLDPSGRNTTLWPDFTFRFAQELRALNGAEHRYRRTAAADSRVSA